VGVKGPEVDRGGLEKAVPSRCGTNGSNPSPSSGGRETSVANEKTNYEVTKKWVSGTNPLGMSFDTYWFEMFDEPWKTQEGPQGPHWGLYTSGSTALEGEKRPGPPMTLGNAVAAEGSAIVRCRDCHHRVEPNSAERYGAETTVLDRRARLVCSKCGNREIDMVGTGGWTAFALATFADPLGAGDARLGQQSCRFIGVDQDHQIVANLAYSM
jgi:hypothetical protein